MFVKRSICVFVSLVVSGVAFADEKSIEKIKFTPPKNTIVASAVEVTAGVNEVLRVRVEDFELLRERTVAIPVKNLSQTDLSIKEIRVNAGCMAAISSSLKFSSKATTRVYLRIIPEKIGAFSRRATILLSDGRSIVVIVESTVLPRFSITPHAIGLTSNSDEKRELTVKSNFGAANFSVSSSDTNLEIKPGKRTEDSVTVSITLRSNEEEIPRYETQRPLVILSNGKHYEYLLTVYNFSALEINPQRPIAKRSGKKRIASIVVQGYQLDQKPIRYSVSKDGGQADVTIVSKTPVGQNACFYRLEITNFRVKSEPIVLQWHRDESDKVIAECAIEID